MLVIDASCLFETLTGGPPCRIEAFGPERRR